MERGKTRLITDDAFDCFAYPSTPLNAAKNCLAIPRNHHGHRFVDDLALHRTACWGLMHPLKPSWPPCSTIRWMLRNCINAVYLRIPVLASVHLFRSGGSGLHAEKDCRGLLPHGKYNREFQPGQRTPLRKRISPWLLCN